MSCKSIIKIYHNGFVYRVFYNSVNSYPNMLGVDISKVINNSGCNMEKLVKGLKDIGCKIVSNMLEIEEVEEYIYEIFINNSYTLKFNNNIDINCYFYKEKIFYGCCQSFTDWVTEGILV